MQFSCNAAAVLTLSLKLAKTRHNTLLHFGSSIVFWIMKWQVNAVNPHLGAGEERTEMKLFTELFTKPSAGGCVDSYKCLWAFIECFKRFFGLQSSLGITNVNRSHNKPLELIETI